MTSPERRRATVHGLDGAVFDLAVGGETPGPSPWLRRLPGPLVDRAEGRERYEVIVDGWRFEVSVEPSRLAVLRDRARRAADESRPHVRQEVRAQIPGRVVAVHVATGDAVATGDRLLSIEAMKMENEVRATRPGTIASVAVAAGERVELGDALLVLE